MIFLNFESGPKVYKVQLLLNAYNSEPFLVQILEKCLSQELKKSFLLSVFVQKKYLFV